MGNFRCWTWDLEEPSFLHRMDIVSAFTNEEIYTLNYKMYPFSFLRFSFILHDCVDQSIRIENGALAGEETMEQLHHGTCFGTVCIKLVSQSI